MTTSRRPSLLGLIGAAVLVTAGQLAAAELHVFGTNLPPVDFHGFASQGFIINNGNNDYLGGDSDRGTFDFREYGVNGSIAYGKWRVGAQMFAQKLGPYGNDQPDLDWGIVDYQAAQWFGLRAGRVKMPRGLYNEALDLDSTRPFVLLPQSVYDARLRDFQNSFDGGMVYGNISLKKFGSLDYKAFYGAKSISTNSGASDYFNIDAPYPNLEMTMDDVWGGTLFWNTPLNGLRMGFSFSRYDNFQTLRYVPTRLTDTFNNCPTYDRYLASVEYTVGDWVFAAEGGLDDTYHVLYFPAGYHGNPNTFTYGHLDPTEYYFYISAAWQVTHRLELGAYYSYWHWDQIGRPEPGYVLPAFPDLHQGDLALSARFDLTDYLIFKIEGHYMDGSGLVFNVPSNPQPPATRDNSWFMFDAKVTFSF